MIALDLISFAALRAFEAMREADEFAVIRALQRGARRRGRWFFIHIGGES